MKSRSIVAAAIAPYQMAFSLQKASPQKKWRRRDGARPKKGSANNVARPQEAAPTKPQCLAAAKKAATMKDRVVISQKATLNIFLK